MAAPEKAAMIACNKDLIDGLAAEDIGSVADKLYAEDLIASNVYYEVQLDKIPSEKARIIVTNVSMKVQANQEVFTMFISALKELGLDHLVKKLEQKYGDVVKKSPQAAPPMAAGGTQGDDDIDAPEVTEILKTDAMKKRYHSKKEKLTEKGLQKLDDEIKSDQHLRLVAEKLKNWEKKADLLDLSLQNVSDLRDQYGRDPYNNRTQALLEWRDKALEPSYHCLLCICIAAEWTDSADVIIELLEKGDEDFLETKELKQRYAKYLKKIPAEKRPKLESEISSEEHLRQISSKLTKWEEKPDLLEIERTEVQDISRGGDPAMERRDALEKWRNRAISPTYNKLLRICIAGTWKAAADEIVQVLTS